MKSFVALFALFSVVNGMCPLRMMPNSMLMMDGVMKMLPGKTDYYVTTPGDDCGSPPSSLKKGNPMKEACKSVS
jgi:hypothetical protein